MTEEQKIYKRSEIVIPECPTCGGRMDPDALISAPAEPGKRGITCDCHYGDLCRECGHITRKANCCSRCKEYIENYGSADTDIRRTYR